MPGFEGFTPGPIDLTSPVPAAPLAVGSPAAPAPGQVGPLTKQSDLPAAAAFSPAERAANLAHETSPRVQAEFAAAIAAERDPKKQAVLRASYAHDFGGAEPLESPLPAQPRSRSPVIRTGGKFTDFVPDAPAPVAPPPPADTSIGAKDYGKAAAAGALSGVGAIAQGGGELLARGVNTIGEKMGRNPELRSMNPFQGAIDYLNESMSPDAKAAQAKSQITGELLKPETWNFGKDPNVHGLALQGTNALGQFAPNLLAALGTGGLSVPAQLGVGATIGGLQALGAGSEEERKTFEAMSPEELTAKSGLYRELLAKGVAPDTAKHAVAEAAALGGGLGNAGPSALEGAFENFLVRALTHGTIKLPSFGAGVAGRIAGGTIGGALTGGTQEAIEQAAQNKGVNMSVKGDRALGEGTLQQFVMGALAEGTVGGAFGSMPQHSPQAPAVVAPAAPVQPAAPSAAPAADQPTTIPPVPPAPSQQAETPGEATVVGGAADLTPEPVAPAPAQAVQAPVSAEVAPEGQPQEAPGAAAPTTAEDVKHAEQFTDPNPTEAQKKSGKYAKGIVEWYGNEIHIENAQGSVRTGTDSDGKKWSTPIVHTYGELYGVDGADGDFADVFIGPHPELRTAFVINQINPKNGKFDEHKIMVGFDSPKAAREGYLANYEKGWGGIGSMITLSADELQARLPEFTKKAAMTHRESDSWAASHSGGAAAPQTQGGATAQPAADPRGERLEAVAKMYDAIGDTDRAAKMRARVGAAQALGEDLTAIERVAESHKRQFELKQKAQPQAPKIVGGARGDEVKAPPKAEDKPPVVAEQPKALEAPVVEPPKQEPPAVEPPPKEPEQPKAPVVEAPKADTGLDDLSVDEIDNLLDGEPQTPTTVGGPSDAPDETPGNPTTVGPQPPAVEPKEPPKPRAEVPPLTEAERAAFFVDGRVYKVRGGFERVLEYQAQDDKSNWRAKVIESDADGNDTADASERWTNKEPNANTVRKALAKDAKGEKAHSKADPIEELLADKDNDALTQKIYEGIGREPTFEDGVTILDDSIVQMTAPLADQKAVEESLKKLGFKITDRLQEDTEGERIQISAIYRPKRSDIQDTGVVGGKPAQDAPRVPSDITDSEKAVNAIVNATKKADFLTIERPDASFGTMLFLEAVRENVKSFLEYVGPQFGSYPGRYGTSPKEALANTLKATPEKVQEQIDAYVGMLQQLESITSAVANVAQAHDVISNIAYDAAADRYGDKKLSSFGSKLARMWSGHALARELAGFRAQFESTENTPDQTNRVIKKDAKVPPRLESITRKGVKDYRKGRNIEADDFKSAFNFREVEFGNWVNQIERQENLNLAYDSLMDLADTIGFEPKFIGLNGDLALAFGSRGQAKTSAAAFFQHGGTGGNLINLTKTNGNGTVAHEWFHALEHHLRSDRTGAGTTYTNGLRNVMQNRLNVAKMEGKVRAILVGEGAYGSERNTPPRDRAAQWLKSGWNASYGGIKEQTRYLDHAEELDGDGDPYYKTPVELVARANEAFIFDALKGGSPYLVGPMVRDGAMTAKSGYKGTAYPTKPEREAFALDYANFFRGLEFSESGIKVKEGAKNPEELLRDHAESVAKEIMGRLDAIMEELGIVQFPEVKDGSMVESMFLHLKNGWFPKDNRELKGWVAQAHRTDMDDVDKNLLLQKAGQEDFEAAIGQFAAQKIVDWKIQGESDNAIFDRLAEMYRKQPNMNIRTSTSSAMQQFSTPLPIAYLAGKLARVEVKTTVYEPTAGNGLLTVTANPKLVIANEMDARRAKNLKLIGYTRVTHGDAVKAQADGVFRLNEADAVLMNPPFGKLDNAALVDGFQVHKIDHLIVGRSLPAMFDQGRAALIIGANKMPGEINSREVPFFNWLYSHYNVASHFEIDGAFYQRQGAAWPIRVITIAGRRKSTTMAPQSGTINRVAYNSAQAQESYNELWREFEQAHAASESVQADNLGGQPPAKSGSGVGSPDGGSIPPSDSGQGGKTAGGGRPKGSAGGGAGVSGGGRPNDNGNGLPGGLGSGDRGDKPGVPADDVGGPGDGGAGSTGAGAGSAGGDAAPHAGGLPGGRTGLEDIDIEDIDRLLDGDPVAIPDPKTGAPVSSGGGNSPRNNDSGPRKPPTGGGTPAAGRKTATENDLGIDLSGAFDDISKIISGTGDPSAMFSRKLYEEALGTVDGTVYGKLRAAFDRAWDIIRAKVANTAQAVQSFASAVSQRFGEQVSNLKQYMRVFLLDKKFPADAAPTQSEDVGQDNGLQVVYRGKSEGGNMGILVPRNQATSLERALDNLEEKYADRYSGIDEMVQKELGYASIPEMWKALSGYQIDNVALSIEQLRNNKGMIIGDATGVGKGRQAAAIIWWSIKNGKVPIFLSFKDDLYSDMYRDMIGIGHPEIVPLLTNNDGLVLDPRDESGKTKLFQNKPATIRAQVKEIASTGRLPDGKNVLFTTYAQINVANERRAAFTKLIESGNAVVIMDEAHNASGESGIGEYMLDLFATHEPPVVYLSATYAKRVDNMPIYMRTNMGLLASDKDALVEMLSAGGPQMQSVIGQMLVQDGQMSRREKDTSMLSVSFDVDEDNVVKDTRLANDATAALRSIVRADKAFYAWFLKNQHALAQFLPPGAQITWGQGTKSHTSQQLGHGLFTSVVHNFVKQLLLSVKADTAVSKIIESLNRDEKVVVPLENTMEAALDYYLDTNNVHIGDELAGYGWKSVLIKALDKRRTFTFKDATGTHSGTYEVPFSALPADVIRTFTEAQSVIDKFITPLSASPIDYMRSRLSEYGWAMVGGKRQFAKLSEAKGETLTPLRVSEITGRKHVIDYAKPVPVLGSRTKEQGESIGTVRGFNSGAIDVVFLNSSGSTGISLHASVDFRDQRKRHMLILQAASDISVFQQTLGRVHRTGQVVAPSYTVLSTALPSEKRPMAVLKKKMTSLMSNTNSSQESATDVEAIDFINLYGDEAVTEYLRENEDVRDFVGESVPDSGVIDNIALVASGRVALLDVAEQRDFYDKVEHTYNSIINMKNEAGNNKLVVRTLKTEAIPQEERVLTDGTGESIFNSTSWLVKYSMLVQGVKPTPAEVRAEIEASLTKDGVRRDPRAIVHEMEDARSQAFEQAKANELNRIEGAGGIKEQMAAPDISPAKLRDLTAQEAAIRKKLATFDDVKMRTTSSLRQMQIGRGARLNMDNGELPMGVVIGIKANLPASGNPWSPSNFVVQFMINNENRRASIPISKIDRDNVIDQQMREFTDDVLQQHFGRKRHDVPEGTKPREDRHFVVGNIPAGFEAVHFAGDVVTFTMQDGEVRTGLLMPRNFDPGKVIDQNLFVSNMNRYGDKFADGIYDYLTATARSVALSYRDQNDISGIGVRSKDDTVVFLGNDRKATIELVIKRSGEGKKIATNPQLVAITGELVSMPKKPFTVTIADKAKALEAIRFIAKRKGLYVTSTQVPASQQFLSAYEKKSAEGGAAEAVFSRSGTYLGAQASTGKLGKAIRGAVDGLLSKWTDHPPVKIVKDMGGLPAAVQAQAAREGATDVDGVFHDGTVYLVLENLTDAKNATTVLMHEVLGHYGLRKTFGKWLEPILRQIAMARGPQIAALLKAQGMGATDANRLRMAEEVLAIMAQKDQKLGFVRRAIAAVASWLREHGLYKGISDSEIIRDYLAPAARTVERGGAAPVADQGGADAKFSRSPTYSRVQEAMKSFTESDSKVSMWSRTVGSMFHLAEKNPAFKRVFDAGQDFLADIWRFATAAEQMAPSWFKRGFLQGINRKDSAAAAQYLLQGTLADKVYSDADLARGVEVDDGAGGKRTLPGLTPSQITMYREAHEAIRVSLETQAKSFIAKGQKRMGVTVDRDMSLADVAESARQQLQTRIDEATDSIATLRGAKPEGWADRVDALEASNTTDRKSISYINGLEENVTKLVRDGYFPLSRFGTHYVAVYLSKEAHDSGRATYFTLHEGLTKGSANRKANFDKAAAQNQYPGAYKIESGVISKESFKLYDGLNLDALELFAKHLGMDQDEVFQQAYKELFNSRSMMKHLIHRKGTPGYSQDAHRVLADFIMTTSRATSATDNFPTMLEAVKDIKEGDVKDHAIGLYKYLQDPIEEAHKLRGYLFFHFIGGSLASAMTNLTQTPMVTAPFLSRFENPAAVAADLVAAGKDATSDPMLKGKDGQFVKRGPQWDDLRKAETEGITAAQEIFQMMGVASGSKLAGNKYAETFLKAWGSMFSYAETFNRRTAYIAAHRIATRKGIENPHEFAVQAVNETQFLYNKGNRPVWARGALGATLFTFKQFSVNVLELMARLPLQQKFYMILLLILMAGIEGLPFAEDIEDLIDTIGQRFPETGLTINTKKWLDRNSKAVFGQFMGNAFVQGLPSAVTPFDLSKRLSLGNLIPGTALGKISETDKFRDIRDLLGPAAGLLYGVAGGAEHALKGEMGEAAKTALPVAAQNAAKGTQMLVDGVARDGRGRFVAKIGVVGGVGKAIGLNPNVIADEQRKQQKILTDENYINKTKTAIVDDYIRAIQNKRTDELLAINKRVADWNRANPATPIVLTPRSIMDRLKIAAMTPDARQLKLAPRPMRPEVARTQRE